MEWEVRMMYWLQTHLRNPKRDKFWYTVTWFGYAASLSLAVSILLLFFPACRMAGWASLIAIGITELFFNHILRSIVPRDRPFKAHPELKGIGRLPKDNSFPSGHTSSAFACAFILWFSFGPWAGVVAVAAASMIAFSRVYLAHHYPTDILGGILAAVLVDYIVLSLF